MISTKWLFEGQYWFIYHVWLINCWFHPLPTGGAVLEDGDGIDLVQCFNPRTDDWAQLTNMMIARSGSAACVLNGYIYVIGKSCKIAPENIYC